MLRIFVAVHTGSVPVTQLMLEAGANIMAENSVSRTAACMAAFVGNPHTIHRRALIVLFYFCGRVFSLTNFFYCYFCSSILGLQILQVYKMRVMKWLS